jgi:hypothetical protein
MGKLRAHNVRIRDSHPIGMAQKTAADHGLVFQIFSSSGDRGVPVRLEDLCSNLFFGGFKAGYQEKDY